MASPPTGEPLSAFLGYNPVLSILNQYPTLVSSLSPSTYSLLTSRSRFPTVIAGPFMGALREAFIIAAVLSAVAALVSFMRGEAYIYDLENSAAGKKEPEGQWCFK